jgi:hypothetical protein
VQATRPLGALAALAVCLGAVDAAAADVFYPTTQYQSIPSPPPLAGGGSGPPVATELHTPGHVSSRVVVTVGVGPDGVPVRVAARQRLRVHGTGDYSFIVPAPATAVARARDSESDPGLRETGIVWQGFSDRGRVLSATATLRPAAAAAGLPLRIAFERRAGSTVVRLTNVARRRLPVTTGRATRADVLAALDLLRAQARHSRVSARFVPLSGAFTGTVQRELAAPLRVTGTVSRTRVDELLGAGRPLERTVVARGTSTPAVRLRVELLRPLAVLPTRRELAAAPRPLERLQTALAAAAITRAYRRYLDLPDPLGASDATFVYRSAPKPALVVPRVASTHDGSHPLTIVLIALLGAGGLAGLAAVWARS